MWKSPTDVAAVHPHHEQEKKRKRKHSNAEMTARLLHFQSKPQVKGDSGLADWQTAFNLTSEVRNGVEGSGLMYLKYQVT